MSAEPPKTRDRTTNRLNARKVETLSTPGRHLDGGGLALTISKTGGKRWIWRFTSPETGKVREMGLGPAGKGGVSLADARQEVEKARALVRERIDPIEQRARETKERQAKARDAAPMPTFGEFAEEWMAKNLSQFRNPKHRQQWAMTLTKYAAPLSNLPINEITTKQVVEALRPIWTRTPETAKRTQGRIERILDAAKALDMRKGENPARWKGHLEFILPQQKKRKQKGHAALAWSELPDFISDLRERQGHRSACVGVRYSLCLSVRRSEGRNLG